MRIRWYAALAAAAALLVSGCAQVGYYVQAAEGQMALISKAKPIDDWLADPAASDALKSRLQTVKQIRRYAAEELGLPDNRTFKTYADLKRPYVLWNVVATPELSLEPLKWCFPVAGCVNYRGYYDKKRAQEFAGKLRREGLDVQVSGVPAYSTLGWFSDPVLSTFIGYPEAQVARLIFHELAHQTVYAAGDSKFNEAEEGGGGARRMMEDGLFDRFPIDAVFGMHNWPGSPVGTFAVTPGPMMASSSEFEVIVKGKGAHAAQPHKGIDPIMAAIQIAQGWQTVVSRNRNPLDTAVLSITQIHSGSATNIIPDEAVLIGTVRTFTSETLGLIERRMREVAEHTAAAFEAETDFRFKRNYPPLINHERETAFAIEVMHSIVGPQNVNAKVEPTMGAEDFAFMLQSKPGCYVFIGNGDGEHREHGHGLGPCNLHNPSYDFNDELLPIGATYWVRLTEAYLGNR